MCPAPSALARHAASALRDVVAEAIAVTRDGLDDPCTRSEFLSQRFDHRVDDVAATEALIPNVTQQIVARDYVVLSIMQIANDAEFEFGEGHATAVEQEGARFLVERASVELGVDQACEPAQHTARSEVEDQAFERRVTARDLQPGRRFEAQG